MKSLFRRLLRPVAEGSSQSIDPGKILFSTSTISNDAAPLVPMHEPLSGADLSLHEDEWRQIEFYPISRLAEIERTLTDLKAFAAEHRHEPSGWRKVFVRDMGLEPVVAGRNAVALLEDQLGFASGPAPVIVSGPDRILGRVNQGIYLDVGSGVALYGYWDDGGIRVLGATVAHGGDHLRLSQIFAELNASRQLILVDWQSQMALVSTSQDGTLSVWQP